MRGSSAQHSSSASLMGGMELLEDLHGLTWAAVLGLVFSGSSVNHLFSGGKKPQTQADDERRLFALILIKNNIRSTSLCSGLPDKEAQTDVPLAPPSARSLLSPTCAS